MKSNRKSIYISIGVILSVMALVTIFAPKIKAQSQLRERIIKKKKMFNPPADIALIRSKIGRIEPNKKILAREDWFEGLAINVRNNLNKPITHISVSLLFPRPEQPGKQKNENELDFVMPLNYGESPIPSGNGQVSRNTAIPILPGQSIDLPLTDKMYNSARGMLREKGFPEFIDNIEVYITTIGFNDGTVWLGGKILRFDPNQGMLVPIKKTSE